MKATRYFAALLVAAFCAAPVLAAGSAFDKAVKLAASDSGAKLSTICKTVYDAVKESPEEADEILSKVIAQRNNWEAAEVYAIFRAVLLARPELEVQFRTHDSSCERETQPKGDCTCWTTKNPMLYKLLAALNGSNLPPNVVNQVLGNATFGTFDLARINHRLVSGETTPGTSEGTAPTTPPGDMPVTEDAATTPGLIPTPGDTSSTN